MNKDFHYYGTYCAAILAKYSHEEAQKIAYWAQFVDECTSSRLLDAGLSDTDAVNSATYMTKEEIWALSANSVIINKRFTTDEYISILGNVWCPFHFLPGNLNLSKKAVDMNITEHELKELKLMCLPNSELAEKVIENTKKDASNLIYVGILMHVVADTWAHNYFAGIPSYFVNEVYGNVREIYKDGDKGRMPMFRAPALARIHQ